MSFTMNGRMKTCPQESPILSNPRRNIAKPAYLLGNCEAESIPSGPESTCMNSPSCRRKPNVSNLQIHWFSLFKFLMAVTATALFAASVAGLAYLDGYYSIARDVRQLLADRKFKKRLDVRIGLMGSHVTMYHMFELADQSAEALWFEGQSWTYGEARKSRYIHFHLIYI